MKQLFLNISILILVSCCVLLFWHTELQGISKPDVNEIKSMFEPKNTPSPPEKNERRANYHQDYRCDGRTYCSQMKSCEEAKYFLQNCPDVKMDGDRDGIPCESQWCQ